MVWYCKEAGTVGFVLCSLVVWYGALWYGMVVCVVWYDMVQASMV